MGLKFCSFFSKDQYFASLLGLQENFSQNSGRIWLCETWKEDNTLIVLLKFKKYVEVGAHHQVSDTRTWFKNFAIEFFRQFCRGIISSWQKGWKIVSETKFDSEKFRKKGNGL